jgi:phosphate transport system substrate-binding protein
MFVSQTWPLPIRQTVIDSQPSLIRNRPALPSLVRTEGFTNMQTRHLIAGLLLGSASLAASAQSTVDPALPDYEPVSGVSGNLSSIGSDTLNNLMTLWAEEFAKIYPNVNIQIQGAGSSTAPPALTEGTANFGPMSRLMRSSEIQAFEERFGYPPTVVGTGIDTIAVIVNKDNPTQCMSVPQVDAVFSVSRRCGASDDISRWGSLGLEGAWANRDFTLYSRNAVSGTYGFFKDNALCGGDFKPGINEQPGSASVVQGVSESLNGIGYSGIGYMTSGVKAVALSREDGGECIEANADNAISGAYPLSRLLYVYVNKPPEQPLPPLEREFFRLVLSRRGQEVVLRDGYIPLPASVAARIREELGL